MHHRGEQLLGRTRASGTQVARAPLRHPRRRCDRDIHVVQQHEQQRASLARDRTHSRLAARVQEGAGDKQGDDALHSGGEGDARSQVEVSVFGLVSPRALGDEAGMCRVRGQVVQLP